MNSVLWDLSKNVSFKFLAQLLLELLVKDWRDITVKRNFLGKISIFWEAVSGEILDRFLPTIWVIVRLSYKLAKFLSRPRTEVIWACRIFFFMSIDKWHSHAYHVISYATRTPFFSYECRWVQKVVKIVCLSLDMLQSVIVSGAVIYHNSQCYWCFTIHTYYCIV